MVALHEFFGVLLAVVVGAVAISAVQPGTQTGAVIGQSGASFANVISAMKGSQGQQAG